MTRVCVVYVRLTGIKITAIIANCVLYLFVCVCAWPFTFLPEPHLNRINGLQQNIISHKGPMAFCECNSWITVLDNWPNGKSNGPKRKRKTRALATFSSHSAQNITVHLICIKFYLLRLKIAQLWIALRIQLYSTDNWYIKCFCTGSMHIES